MSFLLRGYFWSDYIIKDILIRNQDIKCWFVVVSSIRLELLQMSLKFVCLIK